MSLFTTAELFDPLSVSDLEKMAKEREYTALGKELKKSKKKATSQLAELESLLQKNSPSRLLRVMIKPSQSRQYISVEGFDNVGRELSSIISGKNIGFSYNFFSFMGHEGRSPSTSSEAARTYLRNDIPIFVDNGAFPAYKRKEIPPDFDKVIRLYESIMSAEFDPDLLSIVAPDQIGDAPRSKLLREHYESQLINWAKRGYRVLVPIQAADYEDFCEGMAFIKKIETKSGGGKVFASIPARNNKLAYAGFRFLVRWILSQTPPDFKAPSLSMPRIHLLGMGTGGRSSNWMVRYLLLYRMSIIQAHYNFLLKLGTSENIERINFSDAADYLLDLPIDEAVAYFRCYADPEMFRSMLQSGSIHPSQYPLLRKDFWNRPEEQTAKFITKGVNPSDQTVQILGWTEEKFDVDWRLYIEFLIANSTHIEEALKNAMISDRCLYGATQNPEVAELFSRLQNDSVSAMLNVKSKKLIPVTGEAVRQISTLWEGDTRLESFGENAFNLVFHRVWMEKQMEYKMATITDEGFVI